MTKVRAFDRAPPLSTVTCTVPGMAMSAAEIGLVTCDALTNDVEPMPNPGLPGLLQITSAPEMKLLPFTVSVKPGSPAVTLEGDSEEIEGVGPMGIGPPKDDPPPPPQADSPTRSPSTVKQCRRRDLKITRVSWFLTSKTHSILGSCCLLCVA